MACVRSKDDERESCDKNGEPKGGGCKRAVGVPLSDRAMEFLQAAHGIDKDFVLTYRRRPIQEIKTARLAACVRCASADPRSRLQCK